MFGFLKKLRRKPGEEPAQDAEQSVAEAAPITGASLSAPIGSPRTAASKRNGQPPRTNPQQGRGLELPLQGIIQELPLELQTRVRCSNVGELTVTVALEKILSQLSRGSVKISFGELRQAAPQVFTTENDRDRVLVPLPLGEIVSRLNPALITRRRVQKLVEVPDEISNPFDPNGAGFACSIAPAAPQPKPEPLPVAPQSWTATPAPALPARNSISFAPTPPPPSAPQPRVQPMVSASRALREMSAPQPAALAPDPVPPPAPVAPLAPAPAPAAYVETLSVDIAAAAEAWPDAVRKELVEHNLVESKVALPVDAIEQALRQGRIAFPWKVLRSWLRPAPGPLASTQDSVVLELPLKVVAPLFLARQRQNVQAKTKVSVDSEIPNLFFGFPQPDAGNAAVAKPEDTNYYVWDDKSDTVHMREQQARQHPSPGTKFVAKYATPNEVVSRASGLEGVTGALIALPDGLMVASRLSADLNAETLAAFLPQIFGKVSQCTKELRMGELNNLNFTVGNVPWKIFRVNAIFFAALGRAGEPLPTAQLAALAMELDHKPK